jgi:F-type H+-transporting ATPase subunit gamma
VPNLKDIRRRIDSVKKTQQITRAMRMVAGAKLRRAQRAIESARPYAVRMRATLSEVAHSQPEVQHPLLELRDPTRNAEIVVVTSDRGLCGAFNANVLKHADGLLRSREGWVQYGQAVDIARRVSQRFEDGEVDEVVLVYSEFVSPMTQRPREVRLLPCNARDDGHEEPRPFEIEPDTEALLKILVPKAVEVEIYRALLENQAGEHAARMTAMESATRNTQELIGTLTLQFNRARQAAITKELVEIVSGAEAL